MLTGRSILPPNIAVMSSRSEVVEFNRFDDFSIPLELILRPKALHCQLTDL